LSKFIICHYYNYVYDTKRESHGVLLNPMIFHLSRNPRGILVFSRLFTYRNNGLLRWPYLSIIGSHHWFPLSRQSKPNLGAPAYRVFYKRVHDTIIIYDEEKVRNNSFSYEIKFWQIPGLPDANCLIRWTLILSSFSVSLMNYFRSGG